MSSPKIPLILDGKLFKIVSEPCDYPKVIAACQLCAHGHRISGYLNVNSNFIKHLNSRHPEAHSEYRDREKSKKRSSDSSSEAPKSKVGKSHQLTLQEAFSSSVPTKELITDFIVECGVPLSTVTEPSFKRLLQGISGGKQTSISTYSLNQEIDRQFAVLQSENLAKLKQAQFVSTTTDVWSNRKRSFLGVTAHFIKEDTLSRESLPLACPRFLGTHSYDRIADLFGQILDNYELSPSKVVKTTTDNGSNFIKSFKEFGIHVKNAPGEVFEEDVDDDCDEVIPVDSEALLSNETEKSPWLPPHERCCSHTLSLVATTDAKKAKYSAADKRLHNSALGKASALFNKVNYPKSAEVIKNVIGRSLKAPCVTRWNSLFDSLQDLLKIPPDTVNKLCEQLQIPVFKDIDLQFLSEYIKVLEPVAKALDKLQGEEVCFYGHIIPVLRQTHSCLVKLSQSELSYNAPLVEALINGLNTRFSSFLNQNSDVREAMIATVTIPSFKMKPILKQKREELQKCLIVLAEKLPLPEERRDSEREKSDDFFTFSDDEDENGQKCPSKNYAAVEVMQYLADTSVSVDSLHRFPLMKKLFIRFNTPLPSSAPVERLFSQASLILVARRGQLKDDKFEKLLLLKANKRNV